MPKGSPGDKLSQVITAATWNTLVDVAAQHSAGQPPTGRGLTGDRGDKHNRLRVKNTTGNRRRRFEVVALADHLTTKLDPSFVGLSAETPAAGHSCYAILQEPLAWDRESDTGAIGQATVSGATLALVCYRSTAHRFAIVHPGKHVLLSAAAGDIPIISPPPDSRCEHEALILLANTCFDAWSTTTTTAAPDWESPPCSGRCKWVSADGLSWSLDTDGCAPTTTTTAAPDPSSTTAAPTTTTTDCYCLGPTTTSTAAPDPSSTTAAPDPSSTTAAPTTTPIPTTTTTEAPCECLPPAFCPSQPGECTYTYCAPPDTAEELTCPTTTSSTTAAPTSTTTCDCETEPRPDGCSAGCDWFGYPGSTGWVWQLRANHCSSNCPCPTPDGNPFCATAHTDCVLSVDPPPIRPTCTGSCHFVCAETAPGVNHWVYQAWHSGCVGNTPGGCFCGPPTRPCTCGEQTSTPCQPGPIPPTTTTTSATTALTPCQRRCFGTSTTPTTTTTPDCDTGGCLWRAAGDEAPYYWTKENDTCPEECPCLMPDDQPEDGCITVKAGCFGTTTPPPTTTTPHTTQPPTTQPPTTNPPTTWNPPTTPPPSSTTPSADCHCTGCLYNAVFGSSEWFLTANDCCAPCNGCGPPDNYECNGPGGCNQSVSCL